MATEADVLRSVTAILQSGERKEQLKVQTALAMMQLAQQRRAQDIAVAGKNLELMEKYQGQVETQKAQEFVYDSGLAGLYTEYKDKELGMSKAAEELAKEEGWFDNPYRLGLSKGVAVDLVGALWSLQEAQNPIPIIELGAKLSVLADPEHKQTKVEQGIYNAFTKLGYFSGKSVEEAVTDFVDMQRISSGRNIILKEVQEYIKGDYEIQEFDLWSDASKALSKIEIEELLPEKPATDVDLAVPLDVQVRSLDTNIEDKQKVIDSALDDIAAVELRAKNVRFMQELGKDISQEDLDFAAREGELKSAFEVEISALKEDIKKINIEKRAYRQEIVGSQFTSFMDIKREATGGDYSPYY